MATFMLIRSKRRELRSQFKKLTKLMSIKSKRGVEKRVMIFVTLIIVLSLLDVGKSSILWMKENEGKVTWVLAVQELTQSAYETVYTTSMYVTALYHTCVTAITFAQHDYLRSYVTAAADINQLEVQLISFKVLKMKMDDILSITPFVCMCSLFVDVLSVTVAAAKHTATWEKLGGHELVDTALDCIQIVSILLHIDCADRSTKALVLQLTDNFKDAKIHSKLSPLIDSIERSYELDFTAWSLFKLKRSFFLAFVSTCVTFTVLAV
ncbi:hypothetical protein HDE_03994 [Halotydeus destructor]|nr:hypothetical protein HDE_03994 [Halotydeus destructor]